ncbi:hypothetical protein CROQUDRAFT_95526 [Cronartium quercuum f. sp. fusiforme G11]|uniref:Serine hydrolase domain-containing protein n=1 Tax=Cronartium quercuum f. sp. fusiforme G11 TaxID=708437 RepID=A0A9P6NDM9_9BASI|nr:hypothetical protein CROQUDRAFT_95526 [Cronartium quercuum f. sp. fusiforme G11]
MPRFLLNELLLNTHFEIRFDYVVFTVFVDAPHVIEVPSLGMGAFDKFDSTAVATTSSETDPELIPRAWWITKDPEQTGLPHKLYQGWDQTMAFLREVIDTQGPFDACLGFSQGAALAAIVGSVLECPTVHPSFSDLKDKPNGQKALKAVILVAGFKLDLQSEWYGDRSDSDSKTLKTRSLHILGRTDSIVGEDRSQPLISSFENPRVEWHDGGHFVPSKKSWRELFANYLQNLDNPDESAVPSPSEGVESIGTNTNVAKI